MVVVSQMWLYPCKYGVPVDFVTRLPKNDIGECAMMKCVSVA